MFNLYSAPLFHPLFKQCRVVITVLYGHRFLGGVQRYAGRWGVVSRALLLALLITFVMAVMLYRRPERRDETAPATGFLQPLCGCLTAIIAFILGVALSKASHFSLANWGGFRYQGQCSINCFPHRWGQWPL